MCSMFTEEDGTTINNEKKRKNAEIYSILYFLKSSKKN